MGEGFLFIHPIVTYKAIVDLQLKAMQTRGSGESRVSLHESRGPSFPATVGHDEMQL